MKRVCFECQRELTLGQAIIGQRWLNWVSMCPGISFNSWHNNMSSDKNRFIKKTDTKLLYILEGDEEEIGNWSGEAEVGGIIVCVGCVQTKFYTSTGIKFPEHIKKQVEKYEVDF
ncbi:hypothetical protein LCGC14_3055710 [marine sediment metagenome]|uniref:Uncharacterized protein n=1 Tax=marine sediment metagenome TaxID=412755 RepID=A0A0F8WKA8_9ZZZZ